MAAGQEANALWILGTFRRLANSLFMAWRSRQSNPSCPSATDSQSVLGEDPLAKVMRFVTGKCPELQNSFLHGR